MTVTLHAHTDTDTQRYLYLYELESTERLQTAAVCRNRDSKQDNVRTNTESVQCLI